MKLSDSVRARDGGGTNHGQLVLSDSVPVRGVFELIVMRGGEVIERYRDPNMVMNVARDALARLVGGDGAGKTITTIAFGTSASGPTPDDTVITSPYSKALAGHSYPSAGAVRFDWTLGQSQANGKTIREFGLICSDGSLFARKTRGAIEKADDLSLSGSWTIYF